MAAPRILIVQSPMRCTTPWTQLFADFPRLVAPDTCGWDGVSRWPHDSGNGTNDSLDQQSNSMAHGVSGAVAMVWAYRGQQVCDLALLSWVISSDLTPEREARHNSQLTLGQDSGC